MAGHERTHTAHPARATFRADRRAGPIDRRMRGEPTSPVALRPLVTALGIGQIISWGTLFYTIAVLGPPMAQALRVSDVMLYGSFTAGLFVSGIASPWVGSRIDRRGGRA